MFREINVNHENPAGGSGCNSFEPANAAVTAHINLMQGIINRLAGASASCKTWCITLVAALASLAGATRTPEILEFTALPILMFAYLDAMYLAQERVYRAMFRRVVETIRDGSYSRGDVFETEAGSAHSGLIAAFKSWSVWPIYLGLGVLYAIAFFSGWLHAASKTDAG